MTSRTAAALALGVVVAAGPVVAAPAPPPPGTTETASSEPLRESAETALGRARQSYARSDYAGTVALVKPLLYPDVKLGPSDEIDARRLLALSYFLLGDRPDAENEFNALLQLSPDFSLDQFIDPPEAYRALEDLKKRNREKLEEIAAQRRRAEEDRRREEERRLREKYREVTERTVVNHGYVLNFVPFGVGQFQNGQRGKGWFFLSSEAALGATSVALYLTAYIQNSLDRPIQNTPEALQLGQIEVSAIVIGAVFWADVAAGMIDAMVNYVPSVVRERKVVGDGARPVGDARPHLVPFLTVGGGGGVTLQGAF